jgi:osmotically-inducible protein OsmY
MSARNDTNLQSHSQDLLDRTGIPLVVVVDQGRARITGAVTSRSEYEAALDLVKSVDGLIEVIDEIEVSTTAPDSAFDDQTAAGGFEFTETPATGEDAEIEFDPDLASDVEAGTSDFQEAVEEGEPYFPPTDPVVRPVKEDQELEVVGGMQDTSMDELAEEPELDSSEVPPESPVAGHRDDETIREDILRELKEDALTTDLDVDVEVIKGIATLNGTVGSIDDAMNAEEVAGRVPGVVEVRDETTIEQ